MRQVLHHHGVKNLDEAVVVTKSLTEFEESAEMDAKIFKPPKANFSENGEEAKKAMQWGESNWRSNPTLIIDPKVTHKLFREMSALRRR